MTFLHNPRIVALAKLAFWLALVFAVTMAVVPKPPHLPIDRFGDKFAHMLAFATLAALAMIGFGSGRRWRIVERLSFLGAAIEVVQSIPALHRDCDVRDWVADTLTVLVVVVIMSLVIPRVQAGPA
ncbi:MAG TPA: VanZ family protein [Novosphingobium sp.]|nr:VanZ family protein [Novosphingobium sp.]